MRHPKTSDNTSDDAQYDFALPPQLIAQHPPEKRDGGRLMHVGGNIHPFTALPTLLNRGDLLIFNTSKVIPARLHGHKDSGGKIEILLERLLNNTDCLAQIGASKTPKPGTTLHTPAGDFLVCGRDGREQTFHHLRAIGKHKRPVLIRRRFERHGQTPLPPYIRRHPSQQDRHRYQTIYAREPGSVAAPTAGLHFTRQLLGKLTAAGIRRATLQLHVGAGTFMPLRGGETTLHSEHYTISKKTANTIQQTKNSGGRIIAVGTTTLRALESAAGTDGSIKSGAAETTLFIRPGHHFRIADQLITNFHLPRSTLFMLVCAFGGTTRLQTAYRTAIAQKLRFYSYGDAMLLDRA